MPRFPTSMDLFCGAGGMSLGFEQAGFNVVGAFDLEEFNIETHRRNFPKTIAVPVDLSRETGDSLRRHLAKPDQDIDVVFGGPPCQGFSVGGRQDAADERNLLVYEFARLVKELQPLYFVMENVQGLMSRKSEPILKSFLRRIKRAGYCVVEPIRILNAADFGVPQRRLRTFVLGYRNGLSPPNYPSPCFFTTSQGRTFRPVVRDAISDLPAIEDHEYLFDSDNFLGKLPKSWNPYVESLRALPKLKRVIPIGLSGCLRTRHDSAIVKRFSRTVPGRPDPISRYFRLCMEGLAPTIRAGTGRERGSHTAPRPIHPTLPRCITSREAARLHSIPDWFQFHGTRWHDFRQIGNSVPPLLAKAVAEAINNALGLNRRIWTD